MYTCESIKEAVEKHVPNSIANIRNPRGDNEHFLAEVISKDFEGKTLIEQHRMVYKALEKEFKEGLHSLSLRTKIKNE